MFRTYRPLILLYAVFVVLTLFLLVGVVSILPAAAQEATPETVEVVADSPPVVVVSAVTEETVSQLGTIIIGLLMAFVAGGATVGGGLILFTHRLREQPELARAIERLYLSIPAEQRDSVRQIVVGGKEGFDLAEDLTDGDLETPVPTPLRE